MKYEIVITSAIEAALQQIAGAARTAAGQPEFLIDWEVEGTTTTQPNKDSGEDPQVEIVRAAELSYSLKRDPAVVKQGGRQLDAHENWRRSSEYLALSNAYETTMQMLGSSDHDLEHELRAAHDRLINEPFGGRTRSQFRYDPGEFADFIEELLDPEARKERIRLVQSSWSAGNNPHGYTNKQIRHGTDQCIEADIRAFDEMRDSDDRLLGQDRYLPE